MLWSPNLEAYYRFEGNYNDSSGNGHHASVPAPSYVTGKFGRAAYMNTSNHYGNCGSPLLPSGDNVFTFTAWFRVPDTSGGHSILGGNSPVLSFGMYNTNLTLEIGGTYLDRPGLVADEWIFETLIRDGSNMGYVYKNCVQSGASASITAAAPQGENTYLGQSGATGGRGMIGSTVCDVALWIGRVLGDTDRRRVMMGMHPIS